MDELLHVMPAAGLVVRDPVNRKPLPPEGDRVPATTYWHRRIAEGDVTVVQPADEPAPTPARRINPSTARSSS